MPAPTLRIAMLAHSTNPRGGVMHAMSLADALTELGHDVVLHAPDVSGKGFFREPTCPAVAFPVAPAVADMSAMVQQRIAEYVAYFQTAGSGGFDLFHAHDGISANAMVSLKERGLIPAFARTVHHLDQFQDPVLQALQDRSLGLADGYFTVSEGWSGLLAKKLGEPPIVVGNGVDAARFRHVEAERVAVLRSHIGLRSGPVLLCVGGVEERKNALGSLDAFLQLRSVRPDLQLVIAGGASLLNHCSYQAAFAQRLAEADGAGNGVHVTGPLADEDMPALFKLADTLVFPSTKEGFGLVVLEAMSAGTPVVVSSIAPFTEYLTDLDVFWCDPENPSSIAGAMNASLAPELRGNRIQSGFKVAARHSWQRVAEAHLPTYQSIKEKAYA